MLLFYLLDGDKFLDNISENARFFYKEDVNHLIVRFLTLQWLVPRNQLFK